MKREEFLARSIERGSYLRIGNNFNREIRKMGHDLMHNEYPQEFVDSIRKPERSNFPPSDRIFHDIVIIPYVRVFLKNSDTLGTTSM
jgi:hypothetical protein